MRLKARRPFSKPTLAKVAELRRVFGLTLTAEDAHHLKENTARARAARSVR